MNFQNSPVLFYPRCWRFLISSFFFFILYFFIFPFPFSFIYVCVGLDKAGHVI